MTEVYNKRCKCKKAHSKKCPYYQKFEMGDLNTYQRFQLWGYKLIGNEKKYKELLNQFKEKIGSEKNCAESIRRRWFFQMGSSFCYEDIMIQEAHLIPESKKIKSEIALLEMKLEKTLQVERLFDSFLSLTPGDIIISFSGTQRLVKKITEKEIFVERNGQKDSSILKEDLFEEKFSWIKTIKSN